MQPPAESRCPVCRARLDQGPQCRRCKADLSLLFALEGQRRRALDLAYRCAGEGQWRRALAIADGVDALRTDPESRRLRTVCHLFLRDFARAWQMTDAHSNREKVQGPSPSDQPFP